MMNVVNTSNSIMEKQVPPTEPVSLAPSYSSLPSKNVQLVMESILAAEHLTPAEKMEFLESLQEAVGAPEEEPGRIYEIQEPVAVEKKEEAKKEATTVVEAKKEQAEPVLGAPQRLLLDQVAMFLAKFDDQPAFTAELFNCLEQINGKEQQQQLLTFLKALVKPSSRDAPSEPKLHWTSAAPLSSDEIIQAEIEQEEDDIASFQVGLVM